MPPRKKTSPAARKKGKRAPRQARMMTLSDLDQVRVLSDPLRIRILEDLCTEERTTKQVAQRLGEKPTKLYHHVEALERVGLIRLTRKRQNRGTMEKYYMAVARQFRADRCLFTAADAGGEAESDTLQAMISTIFERTSEELRGLVEQGCGRKGIDEQGVLSYMEIMTDEKQGRRIQARLMKLIQSLEERNKHGGKSGGKNYRLTLAFYPMEPES